MSFPTMFRIQVIYQVAKLALNSQIKKPSYVNTICQFTIHVWNAIYALKIIGKPLDIYKKCIIFKLDVLLDVISWFLLRTSNYTWSTNIICQTGIMVNAFIVKENLPWLTYYIITLSSKWILFFQNPWNFVYIQSFIWKTVKFDWFSSITNWLFSWI